MPLHVGTCSWSEKSWVGPFYPPGTKPGDYLRHYATVFNTVEADATYYARRSVEMVRGCADKTPESFVLSCKVPAELLLGSRDPRQLDPDRLFRPAQLVGEVHAFHARLSVLGPRLGPVVIQCPWSCWRCSRSAVWRPLPGGGPGDAALGWAGLIRS